MKYLFRALLEINTLEKFHKKKQLLMESRDGKMKIFPNLKNPFVTKINKPQSYAQEKYKDPYKILITLDHVIF